MGRPSKLTDRQARFVQEYLKDLNATQAAIRAGYSPKTAEQAASRMLRFVKVREEIKRAQAKLAEKASVTVERIVAELARIGFANMADYMRVGNDGDPFIDLSGLTRDQAAAISEITVEDFKDGRGDGARDVRRVKFKLHDKKGALVDLGRHLGMFTERIEHSGPNGGAIEIRRPLEDLTDDELYALATGGAPPPDTTAR